MINIISKKAEIRRIEYALILTVLILISIFFISRINADDGNSTSGNGENLGNDAQKNGNNVDPNIDNTNATIESIVQDKNQSSNDGNTGGGVNESDGKGNGNGVDGNTTDLALNFSLNQSGNNLSEINESDLNYTNGNQSEGNQTDTNHTTAIDQNITGDLKNITQIKNIPDIRIKFGENFSLRISDYFSGANEYEIIGSNFTIETDSGNIIIIPDAGFRGSRKARIVAINGNESIESNQFNILVSKSNISIITERSDIKVGERVKWTKNITLESAQDITIELPKEAENINVKTIEEKNNGESTISKAILGTVYPFLISKASYFFVLIFKKVFLFTSLSIYHVDFNKILLDGAVFGNISAGNGDIVNGSIVNESIINVTDVNGSIINDTNTILTENNDSIVVQLNNNATNYIIEYTTDAPTSTEQATSFGNRVIISAPELNYTNILSFANIHEKYKVGEEDKIKVYWEENKTYMQFDAYDLDGNGYLDYVEWITPHLSNQTFDIILISKAEHLDENRTLIADVYDYVKEKDNNWTTIPGGDYVRVSFNTPLTNSKDITIYAKARCANNSTIFINGSEIPCEIYLKKIKLDALRRMQNG